MTSLNADWNRSTLKMRQMYERTLMGWAMDSLALRQRGLDRPGVRTPGLTQRPAAPLRKAA